MQQETILAVNKDELETNTMLYPVQQPLNIARYEIQQSKCEQITLLQLTTNVYFM
jgi:hypothetical protein